MLISRVSHTLWISRLISQSFPQPEMLIFHRFLFSHACFEYLSCGFIRIWVLLRNFRSIFPHGFPGFWKLNSKLILYFCKKQYFPPARVIFHNCLKSVFEDKNRKNPAFPMTFTEIYSHSRVLISPAREIISRKSHFSEREWRFRAYFQRVAKSFSRENTAHFHFSEYFFRRMRYTYI